jgi:hypothetical protein
MLLITNLYVSFDVINYKNIKHKAVLFNIRNHIKPNSQKFRKKKTRNVPKNWFVTNIL